MIHVLLLVAFSAAVGVVLAAILRRDPRQVAQLALRVAGGMTLAAVLVAWLLYLLLPI